MKAEGRRTRFGIAHTHRSWTLTAMVEVILAVDENASCLEPACTFAVNLLRRGLVAEGLSA